MTRYPEERMKLKAKDGKYEKSDEENFFLVTPSTLRWDGEIEIDVKSILMETPELEKQQLLELNNLIVPLLAGPPQVNKKPVLMLLKKYNQDPADWIPDAWLSENPMPAVPQPEEEVRTREADKMVPQSRLGKVKNTVVNKLGRLFSKVNPKAITSR
jgi:hypothetical protein